MRHWPTRSGRSPIFRRRSGAGLPKIGIEADEISMMKVYYPGVLMIPLVLLVLAAVSMNAETGMVAGTRAWTLWPVTLIATGLEELYLWAHSKRSR